MRQNKVKQQLKKVIIKVVVTIVCVIMVVYTIVQAKNKNLSVAEEAKKTNVEISQKNINDDVDRSIGNKNTSDKSIDIYMKIMDYRLLVSQVFWEIGRKNRELIQ